jgi:hypothetical protein
MRTALLAPIFDAFPGDTRRLFDAQSRGVDQTNESHRSTEVYRWNRCRDASPLRRRAPALVATKASTKPPTMDPTVTMMIAMDSPKGILLIVHGHETDAAMIVRVG